MKGLCAGKQRARSEADKALREQQILDAAATLLGEQRFQDLALADVAACAGLTKAALYRYFRNKELLFLALYQRTLRALVDDAAQRPATPLLDDFADLLLAHPLFCSLSAILHVALETGLDQREARQFKLALLEQVSRLGGLLAAASGQPLGRCIELILQCQQALIGCWHLSHPPAATRAALTQPPLTVFQLDFATTLRTHLMILLGNFNR